MGNRSHEQYALLTDFETNTAYSEAFHTLFANIRFNWENDKAGAELHSHVHTLLLTSPTVFDEQPAVAANLAIVAAQSGTPTILVDADLRAPSVEQRFGVGKSTGLSDLLQQAGTITPQNVAACLQATFVPGLRLLGAGTSNEKGAILLLSPKLETVIDSIRELLASELEESTPGVVIFHSPSVLDGADASVIGALTEQTLLAIVVGRTTRARAKQAQEQLERAHTNLAGIVLLNP